jgi:hypothetical protein
MEGRASRKELDVVQDRVTSPDTREVWVRFPPGSKGPVAHRIERLMSPAGCSRPAIFLAEKGGVTWETQFRWKGRC